MRFDPQSDYLPPDESAPPALGNPGRRTNAGALMLAVTVVIGLALAGTWMWLDRSAPAPPRSREDSVTARLTEHEPDRDARVQITVRQIEPEDRRVVSEELEKQSRETFLKGQALMAVGRHAEAVPYFKEAIRIDPANADAHYKLGLAYIRGRDLEAARQQHATLENLNPNLANLLSNLIH